MDIWARYEAFDVRIHVPWKTVGGVRVTATSRGFGVREDGVGKLIPLTKEDLVVGRDEKRAASFVESEIARLNRELAQWMRVERYEVIGVDATIESIPVNAKDCRIRILPGGTVHKPLPFVTYASEKHQIGYRRILNDYP